MKNLLSLRQAKEVVDNNVKLHALWAAYEKSEIGLKELQDKFVETQCGSGPLAVNEEFIREWIDGNKDNFTTGSNSMYCAILDLDFIFENIAENNIDKLEAYADKAYEGLRKY